MTTIDTLTRWAWAGLGWLTSEQAGNLGSLVGGAVAAFAAATGLRALKDWEAKRARDRRADIATRMIRQVAVTCEEIGAAVCAPAMSIGYAKIATKAGVGFVPITANVVRERFEKRMSHAVEEVRELFKLNVEARVHLKTDEVRVFGLFISACLNAEETARSALGYDDPLSSSKAQDQLSARLTAVNDALIDAREHVVRVLTPVARNGRESDERCPEAAPDARDV